MTQHCQTPSDVGSLPSSPIGISSPDDIRQVFPRLECPDYVGNGAVTQVQVEPTQLWREVRRDAGAHADCYDPLSFGS